MIRSISVGSAIRHALSAMGAVAVVVFVQTARTVRVSAQAARQQHQAP